MSRKGQGKAKARSMRGQGKVKVWSKQRKHNLNSNNNLRGFDTIEINLVILGIRWVMGGRFPTIVVMRLSWSLGWV